MCASCSSPNAHVQRFEPIVRSYMSSKLFFEFACFLFYEYITIIYSQINESEMSVRMEKTIIIFGIEIEEIEIGIDEIEIEIRELKSKLKLD